MKLLGSLLILTLMISSSVSHLRLMLAVYYESKCPDSTRFIVNQLVPTIDKLGDLIHLQLIPFGKAWHDGDKFQCQHGVSECRGNMVQDCAISMMNVESDAKILKYVTCEMETLAGTVGDYHCVRQAKLPMVQFKKCVNSKLGIDLQIKSMYLTEAVSPTFIPTITVNGVFDQKVQDDSQSDLFGTLCAMIPDSGPCVHLYH